MHCLIVLKLELVFEMSFGTLDLIYLKRAWPDGIKVSVFVKTYDFNMLCYMLFRDFSCN